jgi:hypothetical protein
VAVEPAEHALNLLEDAADRVDDLDALRDAIDRAQEIHLAAREAATP